MKKAILFLFALIMSCSIVENSFAETITCVAKGTLKYQRSGAGGQKGPVTLYTVDAKMTANVNSARTGWIIKAGSYFNVTASTSSSTLAYYLVSTSSTHFDQVDAGLNTTWGMSGLLCKSGNGCRRYGNPKTGLLYASKNVVDPKEATIWGSITIDGNEIPILPRGPINWPYNTTKVSCLSQ